MFGRPKSLECQMCIFGFYVLQGTQKGFEEAFGTGPATFNDATFEVSGHEGSFSEQVWRIGARKFRLKENIRTGRLKLS